jgi:hypothetical protein
MDLASLSQKALEHGLGSIEDNLGPLIPFTLVVDESHPDPTERRIVLTRFAAEFLEESLQQAQGSIVPGPGIARYAIAWDGYVTVEGRKWDAILVEAGDASAPDGMLLAQRYEAKEAGFFSKKRRNVGVGNPLAVGSTPSRLWVGERPV